MDTLIYPVGNTKACQYALKTLRQTDIRIIDHPAPEVTHLMLDVPSFAGDGSLRGGGDLAPLLRMLPSDITIVGGNLQNPQLAPYRTLDLLADPLYLAKNAAITAECTLRIAGSELETTFQDTPVLIIGWGRIGKALARLLRSVGAEVTVAARKEADRAMLAALGYSQVSMEDIPPLLPEIRLLVNTAPAIVLTRSQLSVCPDCVKIDLASQPGLEGTDVIAARGLPGLYAPESSGKRIAETILRLTKEVKS